MEASSRPGGSGEAVAVARRAMLRPAEVPCSGETRHRVHSRYAWYLLWGTVKDVFGVCGKSGMGDDWGYECFGQ